MAKTDGGKGSGKRKEDLNKVNEGFDRIFGESKLDKRLREEREAKEAMCEEHEYHSDDEYEEGETMVCPMCSGSGEGRHESETCFKCKGYGEVLVNEEDYYDDSY